MRLAEFACVSLACAALLTAAEPPQKQFTAQQRAWWAFQKVVQPALPQTAEKTWIKTPIDAFVLAKLEEKHLRPNPPVDKATLLRRVTLDLTGLPPTPDELQSFLTDTSPQAYENVVDRLLASPHYGERWARHWLDLARYADSNGFKSDETRPNVWRYRDYVDRRIQSGQAVRSLRSRADRRRRALSRRHGRAGGDGLQPPFSR